MLRRTVLRPAEARRARDEVLFNTAQPFVAGMAVAYFLDPVAARLERTGLSRVWATVVITLTFFAAAVLLILLLVPLVENQVVSFAA